MLSATRSMAIAALFTGAALAVVMVLGPALALAAEPPRAATAPRFDWVLGNSAARASLARKLHLTTAQSAGVAALGSSLVTAQDAAFAASTSTRTAAAEPTRVRTFNTTVDALQASTAGRLAAQLGRPTAEVASAVEAVWAEEVAVANETAAVNNVNASLGVASYKVVATSFFDAINGPGVAVPDKYVKFASLGWRSDIPAAYQAAYPAGARYGVGISLNGYTVPWAPVKDSGPWNVDDNYWNSRYDPVRPRRTAPELTQGLPEAAAAYYNGYNGGNDSSGRKVLNPAGLDLLPPTVTALGQDPSKGMREWVTVWFLWEPGSSLPPVAEGRIAGADRYATSLSISKQGWPKTAPAVTLATGRGFADALCAAPLAGTYGGPVILVDPNLGVTRQIRLELTRLAPKKVFIIGATGALPSQVDSECALLPSAPTLTRLAGVSRYETAANVARAIETSTGTVPRVVVATGRDYPDALAAGPLAAINHWPILLSYAGNELPAATATAIDELKPTKTIVVGGTGAVSERVLGRLPGPIRLSGADRYATAGAINAYADSNGLGYGYLAVTTGAGYADALSAGPFAASRNGMLALVSRYSVPAETAAWVHARHGSVAAADAIGGTSAVDDRVMVTLHGLFRPVVK